MKTPPQTKALHPFWGCPILIHDKSIAEMRRPPRSFPRQQFQHNVTQFYRMAMSRTQSTPHTFVSRLAALIAAGLFALTAASAFAQTQPEAVIPSLITQPINPEVRFTLQHNVHPLAQARYDQGIAPGSMATGRIMLVLKRSDMQEQALKEYLGDQQNPNSPNYRKWLTPAQFGNLYSISNSDLTTVTAWLQSQGFTIDKIPQARNVVIFSGNVAQIQQAFNTSIHKYLINGETHFANSTDPQVPAALAPVIAGIAQLNDFRPKPGAILKSKAHFDNDENRIKPDLTLSNSSGGQFLFTDPADAATIYDTPNSTLNPKYTGTNYDGTGVTLGIAGDSNITAGDVALYRAAFLPSSYSSNQPNIIVDGNDPGINGDAVEALLDLEVSGGIAPGAKVNFYTSADTDLQAGLFLAVFRALDDNAVSILNVSFGACEANEGASGNAEVLAAWEQAAAQGISVTVATGDSGSASCDNDNSETAAQFGLAVSGIASTPYNIAVGGTDYDVLANSFSTYVAASNSSQNAASTFYRTALSYIPESPWNDSTSTNAGGYTSNQPLKDSNGNTNIAGGGGGISSCSDQTSAGACLGGYATPPFQTGLSGFPYTARALPDVSFLAADGLYNALWVVCSDNVANGSPTAAPTDCEQTNGSFDQRHHLHRCRRNLSGLARVCRNAGAGIAVPGRCSPWSGQQRALQPGCTVRALPNRLPRRNHWQQFCCLPVGNNRTADRTIFSLAITPALAMTRPAVLEASTYPNSSPIGRRQYSRRRQPGSRSTVAPAPST